MTTSSVYKPTRRDVMQAIARKRLQQMGKLQPQQQGRNEQERWTERYSRDLLGFCTRVLGMTPWRGVNGKPGQYEVLEAIQDSVIRQLGGEQNVPYIFVVEAGHGLGKCVVKWDMITLSDGTRIDAEQLVDKRFKLLTLVDGKPTEVEAFASWNATETVYQVTTESGKHFTRNAEHPMWAASAEFAAGTRPKILDPGFRPTADLREGDLVAVAEELPAFSRSDMPDDHIKLLAYLIGDGGFTQEQVTFAQPVNRVLDEFTECAERIGCIVTMRQEYNYAVTGAGNSKTGLPGSNPVINLLRRHGLMGKHSRDKRVPESAFLFSRKQLRLFLSRLFGTDGWASVSHSNPGKNGKRQPQREIAYCSISRGLIEDVAYLLQKLGIHSRIYHRLQPDCWLLQIHTAEDQVKFAEQIGIFGKEEAVAAVVATAQPLVEMRERNAKARKDRKPWRFVAAHDGTRWERIVSIEELPQQQTVAISVPEHHTFLTQFYEHNTYGLEAPVMAWFYRCFQPSVVQSTANSVQQVRDTLWKDVRTHVTNARERRRTVMPGLLPRDMRAEQAANHFAMGFTTSDAGGSGTERAQGQHNDCHLWVFEEAEGIPEFMYDAVKRQFTGNTVRLWLLIANPKTSSSTFQEMKRHPLATSFRLSLLDFPNVWNGTSEVPGGTGRDTFNAWIEDQRTFGCEPVPEQDEARHTFSVPWAVPKAGGGEHPPGTIFAPKRGFLYGALGIPPSGGGGDTFISAGRFDACLDRAVQPTPLLEGSPPREIWAAQIGVDCSRFGDDAGTIYSLARRLLRFEEAIQGAQELDEMTRTDRYVQAVVRAAQRLADQGVTRLSVRVDAGYGSGIIDGLRKLADLAALFPDGYLIHEVAFGSSPSDKDQYADLVTEMYALADEVLSAVRVEHPPLLLKRDLTERKFGYVTKGDRDVRKLEKKTEFKKRSKGQSPDDGDGAVLALAPERLFKRIDMASAIAALDDYAPIGLD